MEERCGLSGASNARFQFAIYEKVQVGSLLRRFWLPVHQSLELSLFEVGKRQRLLSARRNHISTGLRNTRGCGRNIWVLVVATADAA